MNSKQQVLRRLIGIVRSINRINKIREKQLSGTPLNKKDEAYLKSGRPSFRSGLKKGEEVTGETIEQLKKKLLK